MREFSGRIVAPGTVTAPALVSHGGLNTLASFQKALQFGDKMATCGDQNNPDLYNKQMLGTALCLPQTIGSTTGGLVLYCACALDRIFDDAIVFNIKGEGYRGKRLETLALQTSRVKAPEPEQTTKT